jgi:hypothetical protein
MQNTEVEAIVLTWGFADEFEILYKPHFLKEFLYRGDAKYFEE